MSPLGMMNKRSDRREIPGLANYHEQMKGFFSRVNSCWDFEERLVKHKRYDLASTNGGILQVYRRQDVLVVRPHS